ncbi:MAG: single-stranded DNA-binding protein [Thalassobium sp.]|nr:MAG: single-stranded DNA-binding protein [Thalassobium sp.]
MGKALNKVMVIGNLCRDPEVRYMPNGNAVANVSLATDESYNDKTTGQKVEQTEFHRITVYGKLAEIIQQYLKKGSKAYFEGKLRTREWEKDGVKRYTTEIIASDMMMLDGRQSNGQQMNQAAPMGQPMGMSLQQGYQQVPQQAPHYAQQPAYQDGQAQPAQSSMQPEYAQYTNSFDDFDDDIPF